MDNLKKRLSLLLVLMLVFTMMPVSASAAETAENYELKVLDFEGPYWDSLISSSQDYGAGLLYGGATSEEEAYQWADEETKLSHVFPNNYGTYDYSGGGHAISNYASSDYVAHGNYTSQLTVYDADAGELSRSGGGHDGSDNFVMHYGYMDGSPFNFTESLPALTFSDGVARVVDSMYVNVSTYAMNCLLNGNYLTEPGGTFWVKAIGFKGENRTGEVVMALSDGESAMITDWTKWDLSGLGEVTAVQFNVGGSADNGYGFSQPAYFAYDDVAVRFPVESAESEDPALSIPEGAPFTAITTDKGGAIAVSDEGEYTVGDGYGGAYTGKLYRVVIPEDATYAEVTLNIALSDLMCYTNPDLVAGYVGNAENGGYASFEFAASDDSTTITVPVEIEDSWGGGSYSLLNGENAAGPEYASDFSPVCFFTFEYGEAAGGEEPDVPTEPAVPVITVDGKAIELVQLYEDAPEILYATYPMGKDVVVTMSDGSEVVYMEATINEESKRENGEISSEYAAAYAWTLADYENLDNIEFKQGSKVLELVIESENEDVAILIIELTCEHTNTTSETTYTQVEGEEKHIATTVKTCECGVVIETIVSETAEDCVDEDPADGKCDTCGGEVAVAAPEDTVLYTHDNSAPWPANNAAFIGELKIGGVQVKNFTWDADTCTVILAENTAQDAVITFNITPIGPQPARLAVQLNGTVINASSSMQLSAGKATAKVEANVQGMSAGGAKTFEFEIAGASVEPECQHTETTTAYEQVEGTETHTVTVTCANEECGQKIGEVTTADCVDEGKDGFCDLCKGAVAVPCQHTETTTAYAPVEGEEKHTVTVTCANEECGQQIGEVTTADCVNDDKNGTCDQCGGAVKVEAPVVSGPWDGTTLSEPAQADGVYQIGSGAELAWFAQKADAASKAILTADIDLGGHTWTSMSKLSGSFDGQNHTVKGLRGSKGLFNNVIGASDSARAEVKNVTVEGTISGGEPKTAGIAGTAYYANFINCHNKANVTSSQSYVAGIVANPSKGTSSKVGHVNITNCSNSGAISGSQYVGGIFGYAQTNVMLESCYNKGAISASAATSNAGGIGGYAQGYGTNSNQTNCYNTGSVSGTQFVGGIIGNMYNGVTATNCYNAGVISGTSGKIGAIAGQAYNDSSSKAVNCYYLNTTCSVAATNKTGAISATALTDAELKNAASQLGSAYQNSSEYPALVWQSVSAGAITYVVTAPTATGITFEGVETAFSTEPYNFTVTINDYFRATEAFCVKMNGEPIEAASAEGKVYTYSVAAPASDMVITVEGVESTETVIWTADGRKLPDAGGYVNAIKIYDHAVEEISYDGDTIVNVKLAELEDLNASVRFTVHKGGAGAAEVKLIPGDDFVKELGAGRLEQQISATSYDGKKIVWTINIVAANAPEAQYVDVTKENSNMFTIIGEDQAILGGNYGFSLSIGGRWIASSDFAVKANGVALTAVGGEYTVENVTEPLSITVEGVVMRTHSSIVGANGVEVQVEYKGLHDTVYNTAWGDSNKMYDSNVPYYHVKVPYGTQTVKVTYPSHFHPLASGSMATIEGWAYNPIEINNWIPSKGGITTGDNWAYTTNADGSYTAELTVSKFLVDANGNGTGFSFLGYGGMGFVGVLSFEVLPCEHKGETYPVYARIESEVENEFKHSVTIHCSICDAAIGTEEDEVCVELDNTDVCGKCEAIMICEHQNQTTTGTRISGWEKHTKVVNCDLCKVQIGESVTEACSDADADGVCDICKSYVTLNGAAVIYSGTGWPYSGYYVAKLTLSGADVLYTDGTTVYLEADTAEDAELSFEVTAGGSSSGNLGINWNDVAENTKTYTTSLVDGEATVKVYAYKASGSGVSRNGTQTFTIKIHECADNDNDGKCDVCGGKTEVFVPVTGITLDQAAATIKVGEQVTLNATIEPENATNSTIIWESEDPGVATVENGVVTGRGKGMVTITAKIDGKSAECVVAVVVPITEINFWDDGDNPMSEIVAPIGEEVDAVACCTPGITTDNRVLFESSNTEIFIVAEDDHEVMANDAGHAYVTIIGQKAGEATLTATSKTNPAVTATLKVIVPCNHADSERTYEYQYTPNNDETHAVVTKEYCADCETFIKETEVLSADCVDEGKDGTCDLCKGAVKVETPVVSGPWDGTTLSEPAQVDGVYQIGSGAELAWFAQKADAASKAVLTADIDLNNKTWTPMSKLSGSFDGQGYTVKNLNGSNGLFTTVAGASNSARAEVRNVTVEGSISSGVKMAGIAGTAYYANFTNCHNKASVSGSSNVGGIVGYVYQSASNGAVTLEKCSNTGSITGTGNAVGGIVGYGKANTNIYNCYNSGSVKGKGSVASSGLTGGIAGYLQSSTVTNCYNIGNIDGSGNYAGGLFGAMYNGVTATNCYNAGTVTGGSDKIGAIAAYAYNATNSKAVNCYYLEGTCSVAATNKTNAVDAGTTVKTDAELRSTEMLNLLGDAYKRSSSYPALTWESVSAGATEYSVTFIETEGVTFAGEAVAYSTVEYDFTVTINEGYYATDAFAVKVNGETVEGTQTGDKTYAYVVAAASDLAITVEGVESTDISLAWPEDMIGIEMTAKDVVTVTADCPAGAEVVFTSDNESVFTVETAEITADENGKATVQIKAVGAGDATLTATAKVNEDIKITANVHVNPYPYVLFDSSKHGAWSGTGYTLSKVIVTGVDVYSYEWENGTCIVRLTEDTDPNAVITFKAEGITGSNGNGAMYVNNDMYNHTVQLVNGEARANVKLAMKDHIDNLMSYRDFVFIPQDAPIIPVVSITITASADSMRKGEPVQLTAHILPENATNRGVTWTVNTGNTNATITEDGKLSAGTMGMGSTYTVTATSKANPEIKATYKIYHDYSLETSITMSKDTLEVKTGETATLSATITGEQFVTDTSVSEWKTADENIATVSGGRVTGVNPGTTTITAVSRHGLEATCEVTVICGHVNRETIKEYEQIEGQEKHTTVTYCACEDKPVLSTVAEACVDTDKDGACDFCKGEVAKKKGDMNGSGEVTTEDAEDVLAAIAAGEELTAEQIAAADMNGDGKLNAIDAVLILQAANN